MRCTIVAATSSGCATRPSGVILPIDRTPSAPPQNAVNIGVSTISGTIQCASVGVWDNSTGALLDGRPVIACRRQLAPMLLGRADVMNVIPHRLAITVRGSDRDPRHFPWLNDWIALDPKKVPTDLPREARVLADMLCTHGAIVGDHGGVTNLSVIAGANWNGIDWGGWAPKLSDFRRVTSPA